MDSTFWNERYNSKKFAYGIQPNDFLKSNISLLKPNSKILCLAEGEGRNAVFLSEEGHQVTAVDYSKVGLDKLNAWAQEKKLNIETICVDLNDYKIEPNHWDSIVCIFGHFPSALRTKLFKQITNGLTKNGIFIMEVYDKDQINYKTGGPQSAELLYSTEELQKDLRNFDSVSIKKVIREINEGEFHNGLSAVIQVFGTAKM